MVDDAENQIDPSECTHLRHDALRVFAQAKRIDVTTPTDPPSPLDPEPERLRKLE
ncbi:MAG: hypothetical protein JRD94_03960 [Deltaproteobacteria bacterium]|nr:hypothetical protein [Deltaproteobacteria bacterium]